MTKSWHISRRTMRGRLLSIWALAGLMLAAGSPADLAAAAHDSPFSWPDRPRFSRHVVPLLSKLGCNAGVCHGMVPKVKVTYTRSRWNPKYWTHGPKYTCLECPKGSEEATFNEGNKAVREGTAVELPNPPQK